MLSDQALKEFKEIWRKQFGEEISDERAVELGINLLNLFDHIYRPVPREWMEELLKIEEQEKNGEQNKSEK
jgi:hypothetical protein